MQGGIGIPKFYLLNDESDYCILVMELLGRNLEDLRVGCRGNFSLSTTLYLIDQMVVFSSLVDNANRIFP